MTVQARWPSVRLSRLVDVVDGPFGSNLMSSHYTDTGARVVRLGNVGAAQFKDDVRAFISVPHFGELRRHEVLAGDVLVAGLGDEKHALGRACIAPANLGLALVKADCFRFRMAGDKLDSRFLMWFLNSDLAATSIQLESRGATRQRATPGAICAISIPLPGLEEQRRIAGFLDNQVALLDRAITLRQQQLFLMKQEFVGLADSLLSLPATGVHVRLGYLLSRVTSGPRGWGDFVTTEGVPFFRSANLRRDTLTPRLTNLEYVKPPASAAAEQSRASAQQGDVLVGITGANAGWVTHVADPALFGAVVSQHVALVRPDGRVLDGRWLAHLLSSQGSADQLMAMQYGGTKTQLSLPNLRDLRVPKVDLIQQRKTAHMLDEAAESLRQYQDASGHLISLLQERKQALITAAVTGKFDVTTARSVA